MTAAAFLPPANETLTFQPSIPVAYRCRVITDLQEFQSLESPWNAFLKTAGVHNLSMTHGFLNQWLKHFQPDQLFVIVVEDLQGNWMGLAPLQINRGRRGVSHRLLKHLQWIGTNPTVFDWMKFAIHPNARETAIIDAIAKEIDSIQWDVLDLEFGIEQAQFQQLCDALQLQPAERAVWQSDAMPYIALPDNEADYEKMRRKKTRLDTNRFCNLLAKNFEEPWQLEYKSLTPESEKLIDQFIELHIQYWADRGSLSDFKRYIPLADFYKSLLADADKQTDNQAPRLLFNVISIGSEILSYHFDVWQGNSYLTHINSYDQKFKKFGPGTLHMDRLVFEGLKRQSVEFSFGRGDEPYKSMWPHEKKPLWQLRLFRSPLAEQVWKIDPFLKKMLKKGSEAQA